MLWEAIAAVVVGVAILALILEPLLSGTSAPPDWSASSADFDDLEETPKGQALAALKEIEFDRATGKLSESDYEALHQKYTAEAVALLRVEAASLPPPSSAPATADDIEALVAARVQALRSARASMPPAETGGAACARCGPRPELDAVFCSSCGVRLRAGGACGHCGASLHSDGRYCEACGSRVAA